MDWVRWEDVETCKREMRRGRKVGGEEGSEEGRGGWEVRKVVRRVGGEEGSEEGRRGWEMSMRWSGREEREVRVTDSHALDFIPSSKSMERG